MTPAGQPLYGVPASASGVNQPMVLPLSNPGTYSQPRPTKPSFGVPGCLCLSVAHIALGVISVLLGIIAVIIRCRLSYVGLGIWGGILFFCVTGALGCVTAMKKQNQCLVIAFMVMSIVSAVLAFAILMVTSLNARDEGYYRTFCYPGRIGGNYESSFCIVSPGWRIAVGFLLAATALAEMVICAVSSSLCCYALSKGCTGANYTPVMVQYVPQQASPQFIPMMAVQPNQPQQQQQQQQVALTQHAPVPAQHGQLSSYRYVTGYAPTPPQPIIMPSNASQQPMIVVPHAGTPQQVSGFPPQQIMLAPSHQPLVLATPPATQTVPPAAQTVPPAAQTVPPAVVVDAKQTAQYPDTQATESDVMEGNDHFYHDDTQGLVATA